MKILLKSMTITLSLIAGLQAMDDNCPEEIKSKILTEVVKDNYVDLDFTKFLEGVLSLKKVCKQWNVIISKDFVHKAMLLGCKEICPEFLNGKLIYRPNQRSDEGMIELWISNLWNPLEGTFDLSQCGDAGKHLSISTGYRKEKKAENASKIEIWFAPRFLIGKELKTTAVHFQDIYGNWNDSTPVGIFWTFGGWNNLGWIDYLTNEDMDDLSKMNLYQNWEKSIDHQGRSNVVFPPHPELTNPGRWLSRRISGFKMFHFMFILRTKIRL